MRMRILPAVASGSLLHKLTAVLVSVLVLSTIAGSIPLAFAQGWMNISNSDDNSHNAQIAVGDDIYVVWEEDAIGGRDIYIASSADNFATTDNLSDDNANTGDSSTPQIAVDGSNVYVVWRDDTTGAGDIYFANMTNGSEDFSSALDPLEATSGTSSLPQIAVAGSNVYVVWRDDTEGLGDIYFKASDDGGQNFDSKIDLSNSTKLSTVPQIAAIGDNVYVVWQDSTTGSGDIYFIRSTDNGKHFETKQTLSPTGTTPSTVPQIAAVGENVYIVWQEGISGEIYFARSINAGENFTAGVNISNNGNGSANISQIPQISAIDDFVYVTWKDSTGLLSGSTDIFFKRSIDGGENFDANATNLSNTADRKSDLEQIVSSDSDVFVTWQDNYLLSTNNEILLVASTDNGNSFTDPINLSETDVSSELPQIASTGSEVHAVWQDFISLTNADIFLYASIDYLEESITVDIVNDTNPKWGVDTVLATGNTVNADPGDTVTVEWGTGEVPSENITIEEDGSWNATHEYSMSAVGNSPHQIIAKIIDATTGDPEATSDPYVEEINLVQHDTILELENIASVVQGSSDEITVTGTLLDNDTGDGIEGQTITFSGDGTTLFPAGPIVTDPDGRFTFTSEVQAEVASGLDVQAHFAGTDEYVDSDSNIVTYDVIDPSATPIDIPDDGEDITVDLLDSAIPVDFNASITFDHLLTPGTIFVQECDAPSSGRYEALENRCLEISLGAQMELGSLAHVQIEFEEDQIPDGYSADDVEIFHEEADGTIVGVTESKDLDGLAVTGATGSFSKFILGAAIHEDKPEGAVRQPLYVGQENVATFRDIGNRDNSTSAISFDKSEYEVGDTAVLTIEDKDANLDINAVDGITVQVASETSYPDTITVELTETGVDTGTFVGSFNLISGPSSGNNLQVSHGDGIGVNYDPWIPGGRLKANVEGVGEAGLIQLSDDIEDIDDFENDSIYDTVQPVVIPVKLELVDAQLEDNANITVTMSYADAWTFGTNATALQMLYFDPDAEDWIDITTPGSLDTNAKTLQGIASAPSNFVIGYFPGGSGGAGGGLGKPGTGIVLDFVFVSAQSSGGGHHHSDNIIIDGGSGGGIAKPGLGGSNVQIDAFVEDMADTSLKVTFETLIQTGDIVVTNQDIAELADTFSSVQDGKGTASIDGSDYTTAGPIFDIDTSDLEYSGFIEVTLPYNESQVSELGSESYVRLLHYDGNKWHDVTTNIDTQGNTVSGKMTSTSPVAVAIVSDGTFGSEYFAANPLGKILVNAESTKPTVRIGEETLVSATIKNTQRTDQAYSFVVQIIDKDGVTRSISIVEGMIAPGQDANPSIVWMPEEKGSYTVQMFVWDGLDNPYALADMTVKSLTSSN